MKIVSDCNDRLIGLPEYARQILYQRFPNNARVTANSQGQFQVIGLNVPSEIVLKSSSEKYSSYLSRIQFTEQSYRKELRIALDHGNSIIGEVWGRNQPVVSATLKVQKIFAAVGSVKRNSLLRKIKTDRNGRFDLRQLPTGRLRIVIQGYSTEFSSHFSVVRYVEARGGLTDMGRIFPFEHCIEGKIVDGDKRGVAKQAVCAEGWSNSLREFIFPGIRTDESGVYRLYIDKGLSLKLKFQSGDLPPGYTVSPESQVVFGTTRPAPFVISKSKTVKLSVRIKSKAHYNIFFFDPEHNRKVQFKGRPRSVSGQLILDCWIPEKYIDRELWLFGYSPLTRESISYRLEKSKIVDSARLDIDCKIDSDITDTISIIFESGSGFPHMTQEILCENNSLLQLAILNSTMKKEMTFQVPRGCQLKLTPHGMKIDNQTSATYQGSQENLIATLSKR